MGIVLVVIVFGLYQLQFVGKNAMSTVLAIISLSAVFVRLGFMVRDMITNKVWVSEAIRDEMRSWMKPLLLFLVQIVTFLLLVTTQYFVEIYPYEDTTFVMAWDRYSDYKFVSLNAAWVPAPLKELFILADKVNIARPETLTEDELYELQQDAITVNKRLGYLAWLVGIYVAAAILQGLWNGVVFIRKSKSNGAS